MIRLLNADEIEVRVQSTKKTSKGVGCILLLYKDARVDMRILDEEYGTNGWQRTHEVINGNLFCNIDIWDKDKECWVRKQDVGVESNTEKEKGQASDSFKRAGFNIGIGRELYSSPFIWINLNDGEYFGEGDKPKVSATLKFSVKSITYNDKREIESLDIVDNKGTVRYSLKGNKPVNPPVGNPKPSDGEPSTDDKITDDQAKTMFAIAGKNNTQVVKTVLMNHKYSNSKDIKTADYDAICKEIQEAVNAK